MELVNKALTKDNQAMEILYNSYYKDVLYVCKKLSLNDADANDIAQDTFIDAFSKLSTLNDKSKFKQWVCRIANNKALNLLKHNNILQIDNINNDNSFVDIPDKEKGAEDQIIENEIADILKGIIEKLPLEQKITVFMYYYEDMSVKEIAMSYNCSENTVRSRLNYAKKFITNEVNKLENDGIKLRCTALLPFLYILFAQEKKAFAAAIPESALPSATSVIAKTMKNCAANTANAAGNVAKTFSIGKIIGISSAVVSVIAAATIGFVLLTENDDNNKKESNTEYVSSNVVDNNNTSNSDSDSNEESKSTDNNTNEDTSFETGNKYWDYYPMELTNIPEITYTKIEYLETKNGYLTANIADTFFTLSPDEVIERLKNSNYAKNQDYIFTDKVGESCTITDFSDVGIQKQYKTTNSISAYSKASVDKVMTNSGYSYTSFYHDIEVTMTTDYTNYNTPNKISVGLQNIDINRDSQADVLDVLNCIFGEAIAKYLVYASDKDGKDSSKFIEDENLYDYIKVGSTTYTMVRTINVGSDDKTQSGNIYFQVEVTHKGEKESYYTANYTSTLTPEAVLLDKFILGNFGSIDFNNISTFGSEYMKHGLDEVYARTISDGYSYKIINYPDGTTSKIFMLDTQKGCEDISNIVAPVFEITIRTVSKDGVLLSLETEFDGDAGLAAVDDDEEADYSLLYSPFIAKLKALFGENIDLSELTMENFLEEKELSFEATYLEKPCTVTISYQQGVNMAELMVCKFEIDILSK